MKKLTTEDLLNLPQLEPEIHLEQVFPQNLRYVKPEYR